jgi:hypothetical protein
LRLTQVALANDGTIITGGTDAMTLDTFHDTTTGTRSIFFTALRREVWAQWLGPDQRPNHEHPQGYRWGVSRNDDGASLQLFAGRLCVVISKGPQTVFTAKI